MRARAEAHLHIGRAKRGLVDCISVRDLPNGKTYHAGMVVLDNAKFVVQPAGLRRFRETGQKNVHAFVRGDNRSWRTSRFSVTGDHLKWLGWREARYNPAEVDTFVDVETGLPVHTARFVILSGMRVYYFV